MAPSVEIPELGEAAPQPALCDASAAAPEAHSPPGGVPAGGTSQAAAPAASAPPESTPQPATATAWSKQAYDVEYNLQMRELACLNWHRNPKCRCVRCQAARDLAKEAAKIAKADAAAEFRRLFG